MAAKAKEVKVCGLSVIKLDKWNLDYREQWVVISTNKLYTKGAKHYAVYCSDRFICSFAKANIEMILQATLYIYPFR